MPANDHARPYLYKVCALGDRHLFAKYVEEMSQCCHEYVPSKASSHWRRLINIAVDNFNIMVRSFNIDDIQRSLPLICTLPPHAYGADILFALHHLAPSMPLTIQHACAEACAQADNSEALLKIIEMVEPCTAEKWLVLLSVVARDSGHVCLAKSLDDRQFFMMERREITAKSRVPMALPLSVPLRL